MDEIWERAVETALDGKTDADLVRTLTLDGAVKCAHGRLPARSLFDKFQNLQHLSMANIGVSSLEQFPRIRNLQRLILSDNRIVGGLEFLVGAGLESLRDLDLSNNRISNISDLRPFADLRLVSLDLYECPVTRMKDYRSRVFGLIRSLKYLDKMDSEGNERPESDDEEDEEDGDEDEPGSGEIDGGDRPSRLNNGHPAENDVIVDADEEEESDADEEVAEMSRGVVNGNVHQYLNGFRVEAAGGRHEAEEEGEEERDSVDEVYEDEDVVEVHEIVGSDGVDDDVDDYEDEEEVDNEERDFERIESTGRLMSTEGEIDGHEQGEDDADEDDNGETGEEELAVEEDVEFEDEEDDYGSSSGYLVQPVGRVEVDAGVDEDDLEMEEEEDDGKVQELPPSSTKRKRSDDDDSDNDDDSDDDGDGDGDGDGVVNEDEDDDDDEEDVVQQYIKSSSKAG